MIVTDVIVAESAVLRNRPAAELVVRSTVVVPTVTGLFEESSRSTVIVPLAAPAVKVCAVDVILSLELTAVVVKLDVLLPLLPAASPWVTLTVYWVPPESAVETFTVQAPLTTATPEKAWTGATVVLVPRYTATATVPLSALWLESAGRVPAVPVIVGVTETLVAPAAGAVTVGAGATVSTRTGPLVAVVVHWP